MEKNRFTKCKRTPAENFKDSDEIDNDQQGLKWSVAKVSLNSLTSGSMTPPTRNVRSIRIRNCKFHSSVSYASLLNLTLKIINKNSLQ